MNSNITASWGLSDFWLEKENKSSGSGCRERKCGKWRNLCTFDWWCYLWSGMQRSKLSAAAIRRAYHNQITLTATTPSLPVSRFCSPAEQPRPGPVVSMLFDGDGLSRKYSPITSRLFSVSCTHLGLRLKESWNVFVQWGKIARRDFHTDKNGKR